MPGYLVPSSLLHVCCISLSVQTGFAQVLLAIFRQLYFKFLQLLQGAGDLAGICLEHPHQSSPQRFGYSLVLSLFYRELPCVPITRECRDCKRGL